MRVVPIFVSSRRFYSPFETCGVARVGPAHASASPRLSKPAPHILPFPVAPSPLAQLEQIQERHSAAVENDDMLAMFYANLDFHQTLFGLCGNVRLIDTIRTLE